MILVKNWKFPLCLFLGKISYEITFDNHLVRKQALQYYKDIDFNVAKYHLGKVKLERVGQQSSPTSVCDLRGGPRGIAGLLVCPVASVALHCSFAC